jgi:uncharacterized membrane protein YfcA
VDFYLEMMSHHEILTTVIVLIAVVVQSLIGIGVLFLGTPILMLLGNPFIEILCILLPVSFSINALQVIVGWKHIQWYHVRLFLTFALPATALGSLFMNLLVGLKLLPLIIAVILLIMAVGFYFSAFPNVVLRLLAREKWYLFLMGLIQGITNLGGPLLSAYVMAKLDEKQQARGTTALCYAIMVLAQIITLWLSGTVLKTTSQMAWIILMSMLVFLAVNQWIFLRLNNHKFKLVIGIILLAMSLMLIAKQLI